MRRVILLVALTTAFAAITAVPVGGARADDGGWKAAHDTDPHLPLTARQLDVAAAKRAVEARTGGASLAPFLVSMPCGDCGGGGGYASSAHLAANQAPQSTSYYCGPASVHEALGAVGVSLSQAAAAAALRTTTAGTAWSGGGTSPSGYPVPDVLNAHERENYYVPQPVGSASSSATQSYESDLQLDIYLLRVPLVGDAWEAPGGPHLVGHPASQQIFHWFEIRGYKNHGASTMYEDSVHGAGTIGWSRNVPAYSTLSSSTIVTIVSGRGYVW
jgi:hypothetical protein